MTCPLVDSHAHITSPELLPDLDEVLRRAEQANICAIVNICTDQVSLDAGLTVRKDYPWVHVAAAVTPHDAAMNLESFFSSVETMAHACELIAIGETGLDYYYSPNTAAIQKQSLCLHFNLAKEFQLPLIIHCRDAFHDLFAVADKHYAKLPAVLHCFTGTSAEARAVLARGWYLSFSGIITFKNAHSLREVVRETPLQKMFIETDAPYLAPQTKRGKRNEPAYVRETAECIAAIKKVSLETVVEETTKNARDFFGESFV